MTNSGIKRGLAVAATSALALVGLPFLAGTATAAPSIDAGQGANIVLYSLQSGNDASTQHDGADQTVRILVGVKNVIAGNQVHSVRLKVDGATVAETGNTPGAVLSNGVATFDLALPNDTSADFLVEALDNFGNVLDDDNENGVVVNSARNSVHLANAPLSEVGQWNGQVILKGTASTNGNISLSQRGPVGAGGAEDPVANAAGEYLSAPDGNGIRAFTGTLDVSAQLSGSAEDVAVVRAQTDGAGSDHVTAVKVYDQTLANVTKSIDNGSSENVGTGNGVNETSAWTLKAVDQKGNPIHGVRVWEAESDGSFIRNPNGSFGGGINNNNARTTTTWDGVNAHTDANGEFKVELRESDIDNIWDGAYGDGNLNNNEQTAYYVFDRDGDGNFEVNDGDFRIAVTQKAYAADSQQITITNRIANVGDDVTAMDDDEQSTLRFTVKDSMGNPMPGETVRYRVRSDDATENGTPYYNYTNLAVTNAQGFVEVNFNTGVGADDHDGDNEKFTVEAYINNDGDPNPSGNDAIAPAKQIELGESVATWDSGTRRQELNGRRLSATPGGVEQGTLALESGTKLEGRRVAIDYDSGNGGGGVNDNSFIPAAGQPASVVVVGDSTAPHSEASVKTSATGNFQIDVEDPASPNGQETDATLAAANVTGPNGLVVEQRDALKVDWLRSLAPATMEIRNANNNAVDSLFRFLNPGNDNLQPGKLGVGYVLIRNADGVILSDAEAELKIGEGNFVDVSNAPTSLFDPAAVVGNNVGEWSNAGKTVTVTTGDDYTGAITGAGTRPVTADRDAFAINIERHEGFDDDGLVDDKVNASAGAATFEHDFQWNTITTSAATLPLNNGSFSVTLSADQESPILPKARAGAYGHDVTYDVVATDQFGNRTKQNVTILDNTPLAHFTGGQVRTQFTLENPAITAWADSATNQSLEVELSNQTKSKIKDIPTNSTLDLASSLNNLELVTPDDVQTTTAPINWYNLDLANSTFTLGQAGAETIPVGSTVNEIAKAVDQEGAPIAGLDVTFTRSGPSDEDSDGNVFGTTGAAGNAVYTFAGGKAGTATTTASFFDGNNLIAQVEDKVEFKGGTGGGQVAINAKIEAKNNGAKKDKLKVNAGDVKAKGATVKLYRVTGSGDVLVGTKTLNKNGKRTFKVTDRNGNKKTKYYAVVSATDLTKSDRTPTKKVK